MTTNKIKQKNSAFIVYPSVMDALRALPEDKANAALRAIIEYGIVGNVTIDDDLLKVMLIPTFSGIDTQKRRYRNIRIMNLVIDDIYRRLAGVTDKCGLIKSEKTINCLKKIVVECQKQDLYLSQIVNAVNHLMNNPDIKSIVSYGYRGREREDFITSPLWISIENKALEEHEQLMKNEYTINGGRTNE